MSIVKMKRIRLIALEEDRDALLSSLLHVGCVEVREPADLLADENYAALLHRDTSQLAKAKAELTELERALEVLGKYAPQKTGLLKRRGTMGERELLDPAAAEAALAKARTINEHAKVLGQLAARETRLHADALALQPWAAYDLPLEEKGTRCVSLFLGTVPAATDVDEMWGAVSETAEAVDIQLLSQDRELKYLAVMVHRSQEQAALEALRTYRFAFSQLKDMSGTVAENLHALDVELEKLQAQRQEEVAGITAFGPATMELKIATDRVEQTIAVESSKERLLTGGKILYLDGWVSVPKIPELEKELGKFDCAVELADPTEEEYPEVPVELKNNCFTRPLNMVTDMYSLPAYNGVDPNPLMAFFFVFFYGFMMADMGYGLVMMLISLIIMKKAPPNGATMKHMIPLLGWGGLSTFIMGALTGGFFGDMIPQLLKMINPESTFAFPALFNPLDDALMVLIGSLGIGLVQIFTGMGISVYMKIKRGQIMDAVCNEIAWYLVFILFAVGLLAGQLKIAGITILVLLVLTQGYGKKGIMGKLMGIFGSLYNNITGYFSDILSYSRLMALMLAGAVIAQVFNTLGAITGNVITFFIISIIGNTLNFALNLLGCYVHDMRLQCLEFFGRFYEDGGKAFRPLSINTKHVDIVNK